MKLFKRYLKRLIYEEKKVVENNFLFLLKINVIKRDIKIVDEIKYETKYEIKYKTIVKRARDEPDNS